MVLPQEPRSQLFSACLTAMIAQSLSELCRLRGHNSLAQKFQVSHDKPPVSPRFLDDLKTILNQLSASWSPTILLPKLSRFAWHSWHSWHSWHFASSGSSRGRPDCLTSWRTSCYSVYSVFLHVSCPPYFGEECTNNSNSLLLHTPLFGNPIASLKDSFSQDSRERKTIAKTLIHPWPSIQHSPQNNHGYDGLPEPSELPQQNHGVRIASCFLLSLKAIHAKLTFYRSIPQTPNYLQHCTITVRKHRPPKDCQRKPDFPRSCSCCSNPALPRRRPHSLQAGT